MQLSSLGWEFLFYEIIILVDHEFEARRGLLVLLTIQVGQE